MRRPLERLNHQTLLDQVQIDTVGRQNKRTVGVLFGSRVAHRWREVSEIDAVAAIKNHGALHDVTQLTDIASPTVLQQLLHGGCSHPFNVALERTVERSHKVLDEQTDVFSTNTQRGHRHLHNGKAVVQVFAKSTCRDLGFQITVRSRNDGRLEVDIDAATDALEASILECAQQLGLHGCRQFTDLIQKDHAVGGQLKQTTMLRLRIGERASLMTKERALQQRLGDRRAIHLHIRPLRALSRVVNGAGDQVLAGTRLPMQQHIRERDGAQLLNRVKYPHHGPALPDKPPIGLPPRTPDRGQESLSFQCISHRGIHIGQLKRLGQVAHRTQPSRFYGRLDVRKRRQHQHRSGVSALAQLSKAGQAVHLGHAHVDQQSGRRILLEHVEAYLSV